MSAGRTTSPLRIAVAGEYDTRPEVAELRERGHRVEIVELTADLILHPNAHAWSNELWPLLAVAIKAARVRRADRRRT